MSQSIGKPVNRVDGRLKVTGGARYSAEIPLQGLVHAVFVTSTIAKGRIEQIDTRAAEQSPGVLSVLTHLNMPKLAKQLVAGGRQQPGMSFAPMQGPEIHYSGQQIAIAIADTLERATHAARLVQVRYRQETPVVTLQPNLKQAYQPEKVLWGFVPGRTARGNPSQALAQAPVKISETYTLSTNHHNPLEPSATTAVWEGDTVTVYNATQGITGTQKFISEMLAIPIEKVRVIGQYVGGGFGCKASSWPHEAFAVIAARELKRPVKLVLTREQMYTSVGSREEQALQISLGATRDGKLTAISHTKISPTSPFDEWAEPSGNVINMMYTCPNFEATYRLVRTNIISGCPMRGPGEVPGMYALECAMDELAYTVGLDPIELRLRNHADVNPADGLPWSSKSLKECYKVGAERFGWAKRNSKPRSMRDGRYLIGYGMASATYPVYSESASARAQLFADGRVVVKTSATDIGTGTYTILTQVAADALGLPVEQVKVEIGDSQQPKGGQSGGSTGAGTNASAVHLAATNLRRQVVQLGIKNKRSPLYGAKEDAVKVENGRLFLAQNSARGETYSQLLTRLGHKQVEAMGEWDGKQPSEKYAMHAFGADFAEVAVDPDLGLVRVRRLLGVYGAGRILNVKTARSQVIGGMVWGMSQALLEHTSMDVNFGRYTNANFAEYLVPVNADIPGDIEVEFIDERDPHVNVLGVKGIGELAMVGASAAIANAIYHATGKRIRDLPITPDKLL